MKKEGEPAEIKGVHTVVFSEVGDPFISCSPQESENRCSVLPWGIATVAAAYSNEETGVKTSMDLAPQ